ncbi:MAG: ankyrin repeat domain-containing protein [bacterium]
MTGLHHCVRRGHYELCELLILNSSHIDALDICGRTPLYFSLVNQHFNVFSLLLYYKSDVKI